MKITRSELRKIISEAVGLTLQESNAAERKSIMALAKAGKYDEAQKKYIALHDKVIQADGSSEAIASAKKAGGKLDIQHLQSELDALA